MPIFLNGLALQNYRGIGPERQRMAPFRDFNFFIGANNAGKSTVLNFLKSHLDSKQSYGPLDKFAGGTKGEPAMSIAISSAEFIAAALNGIANQQSREHLKDTVSSICRRLCQDGFLWFSPQSSHDSFFQDAPKTAPELRKIASDSDWFQLWNAYTNSRGGSLQEHWGPQTLARLADLLPRKTPKVDLIIANREIGNANELLNDFSGRGLIDHLAKLQSPGHDARSDRNTFQKINQFLRVVTGRTDAAIEIPHHREHILVHMDDKILPLSSLGTGIHEVIMIAAFCNIAKQQVVCIEEPEIHLHPILQRKLIHHLRESTDNQYFIATHSATFIDTQDAAIFHVTNDGTQTHIRPSLLRKDRFAICVDLGHRASDIVQSNAVIWVEGPSDRIYLKHWISEIDPSLIEGTHYSIMFYGGRLLSHLSADDEEISEFIQLRSLNRHLAILIDSDRSTSRKPLNATKRRVVEEFRKNDGGVAWVTKGREIENYVDHTALQEAVRALYPSIYAKPALGGSYDHALHFYRGKRQLVKDVDKVKVAKLVCQQPTNFKILDLSARLREIIEMIKSANQ